MADWQNIKVGKSTGIIQNAPNHIEIASIRTPTAHRGQGGAHAVMKHIVDYANSVNKPARLVASPLDKKTRTDKLVSFYQKYGFEPTGEKANQVGDPWMERPASNIHKSNGGDVERFHGTDVHNLQKFDPSASRTAKYHYLADEPETAGAYGKHVYRVRLKPKNIISFHPENIGPKQMKVVHELSERLGENPDHLLHAITSADGSFYGTRGSLQDRVMDELKDMGHDAVRFPDVAPGGGWDMSTVVLDNSIIHSIDKHDPAIGKEGGGPVEQDGITAYHGSPHDFDEFDTSKIGTGEGAQAYGHGLYFAEHEPVAKGYRDALAQTRNPTTSINELIEQMSKNSPQSRTHKNIQWYMKQDPMLVKHVGDEDIVQHIHDALNGQNPDGTVSESALDAYGKLTDKLGRDHKGHMYEVHINAHPHHFLDWDKPLSEQSEHVQKILGGRSIFEGDRALGEVLGRAYRNELFGGDVAQMDRAKPHVVSESLAKQGIKGIKYQDAGSRGAGQYDLHVMYKGKPHSDPIPMFDKAQAEHHAKEYQDKGYETEIKPRGTHNYVVFDHNDVNIKRKYEQGGRVDYNTGGPVNVSKAEDTAGNFKKEHEKIHGIPVAIEVKEGHDRVKYEPNGDLKFKAKQYADYGAILGTKDADGMNTDVMVGPHKDSEKAYIIDQRKHDSGKFDEHKVMLGFNKRKKAIKAYTKSYADRHGKERVQDVVKTDIKGLKKWLKHGNLDKPASKDALIKSALSVVSKKT